MAFSALREQTQQLDDNRIVTMTELTRVALWSAPLGQLSSPGSRVALVDCCAGGEEKGRRIGKLE